MEAALHSVFTTGGPEASEVLRLIAIFVALCAAIYVAVALALFYALGRRRRARPDPLSIDAAAESRAHTTVVGLTVLTGLCIIALTAISYATQSAITADRPPSVRVRLTGHQFWWEAQYRESKPNEMFATANEIVVPVGEPVLVELEASDVIHSLWFPSLMGKQDLIPGQQNILRFTVAREGVYRGQCAEFCGLQHAHMALLLRAVSKEDYAQWRARQLEPGDDAARQIANGERIYLSRGCGMCHTIRGTTSGGRTGPDLTHVGSRETIAAGLLPRNQGSLAAWIADPQRLKPGTQMPRVALSADELQDVSAYLEALK
ncbi:MAG: cytochrome c oxidase, subunit [Hyphomicrobiales bacterium]|jgi:cytochrome c oxidase subunit 2|nr:cytochrome c oxidase, subunit [Hyphomicrobiales bacterium]